MNEGNTLKSRSGPMDAVTCSSRLNHWLRSAACVRFSSLGPRGTSTPRSSSISHADGTQHRTRCAIITAVEIGCGQVFGVGDVA